MANNIFVSNAAPIVGGQKIVLVRYKVQHPQKGFINQLSIDLNPANDFQYINFSLLVNGALVPEMANINSQITQSYYPMSLPVAIDVPGGGTIEWVVSSTQPDAAITDTVFASLAGILRG